MRYSEFEELVVSSGYEIDKHLRYLNVRDELGNVLLFISLEMEFVIGTNFITFRDLPYHEKDMLFNLAVELASTPLQEREDEKRYRLKLPFGELDFKYLNLIRGIEKLIVNNRVDSKVHQTIFTESEIAELKAKHNLDSFVLEEVKEDE